MRASYDIWNDYGTVEVIFEDTVITDTQYNDFQQIMNYLGFISGKIIGIDRMLGEM